MTKHFLFLVVIATALCDVSRPLLLMRQPNLNADSVSPQHKPVSAFIFGDIKKTSANIDNHIGTCSSNSLKILLL